MSKPGEGENANGAPFYPYVEVLRILGAMAVVWAHYGKFRIPAVKLAVPCFVVISFFFGWRTIASGDFARLRRCLLRLAVPFFAWGAASYAVAVVQGAKSGISPLMWQMLLGHSTCMPLYYLWDVAAMTVFLFALGRRLSGRAFWWAAGGIVLACFALQLSGLNYRLFGRLPFEAAFPLGRLAELLPSAVAGCAIAAAAARGRGALAVGLMAASVPVVLLLCGISGAKDGFGYAGPLLLAGASGMVLAATAFTSGDPRLAKIRLLSEATAGVYFIHTIVGDVLHVFKTPKFPQVLLISLLVTLIGLRLPIVRVLFNGKARKRPVGLASG